MPPARRSKRVTKTEAIEPPAKGSNRLQQLLIPAIAILLIAIAYQEVRHAAFVYDDRTQILENNYIQNARYFWKSMTVDVWAFRGDKGEPWSNYWRPVFVAWLFLNYKLFGFQPAAWHLASVVAHCLATFLVYRLLVRWKVSSSVQATVTWLFAVHPVHVPSVAWISGIPDVLMSIFLLGSLLVFARTRERSSYWMWALALVLFAGGLLSKEVAIAFPLVIAGLEWCLYRSALVTILRRSAPFVATALVYLAVRSSILGGLRQLAPGAPSLGGVLLSLPEVLAFYVRQSLLPFALGPVYGARPVAAGSVSFGNVFGPLLVIAGAVLVCWLVARSSRSLAPGLVMAGVVWFLGFLCLALDIRIFLPELMVQDRYLYLPVLGLLLIAALGIDALTRFGYVAGLVIALVMAGQTYSYTKAWSSEVALWERGVRIDPTSAAAQVHLGEAYRSEGRFGEARTALEASLAINPDITVANIAMGALDVREGRFAEAETYLRRVLSVYPDYAGALEQLALALTQQKKFDEAIELFRTGANRMPYNAAQYDVNIAVIYRLSGRRTEARKELESLRERFASSTDPKVLIGWFYLGELNREEGRIEDAKAEYVRYLRATNNIRDNAGVDRLRQVIHGFGVE